MSWLWITDTVRTQIQCCAVTLYGPAHSSTFFTGSPTTATGSCDFKDVSAAASNSRVGNLGNMEACFRLGSSVSRFFINRSHDPYGHIHCGEAVTLSANFEHEQCQCNLHLSSHSSAVQQAEPLQFHIPLWTIILTARRADNAQHKQLLHSTF